jgi:SAM-dependent methyltransferase
MFEPINLSAYADPLLDELVSGEPNIDGPVFWGTIAQTEGPILELGCGYGRVTIPVARRGVTNLTGLELSAPSLAYARTRAENLPIRWVEADVRTFHLGTSYALIFARGGPSILCSPAWTRSDAGPRPRAHGRRRPVHV